jgi:hypothetical protein
VSLARYLRRSGYLMCGVALTANLLGAKLVDAATYYVATTGSDANSGTKASPFQTINRGRKALASGDTLFINSGVYAEELTNPLPSGLSASQPTRMTGPAESRPIIRPTTSNNGGYLILLNSNRSHLTFENLVLDASLMPVANSVLTSNSATIITNLVLQDCEAIGRTGAANTAGAVTIGNNTQATVRRCSIHGWRSNTSNPGAHGFYWRGKNGLIEFNQIFDNNGYGLQFYSTGGSRGGVDNNVFRNNYVHGHNVKGGLYIGSGVGNQAYNNIIVNNNAGIVVRGQNTKIFNNTVYNNLRTGMQVNPDVVAVIRNNIVYNNRRGIWNLSSNTTVDNNLTSDPLFVDPATNNFKLQAASPAIDAGATLSEVQDDYVTVPRPQGSGYDIGAYEYTGSTTSVQPTTPTRPLIIDAK